MKMKRREFLKVTAGTALLALAPPFLSGCGDSGQDTRRIGAEADLHMHLMRQKTADHIIAMIGRSDIYGRPIIESSGQILISKLDRIGAAKAFAFSSAYLWGSLPLPPAQEYEEAKAENDWAAAQATLYPDRLLPFFSVFPFADYALEEIDRCKKELRLSSLKLHFGGGAQVDLKDLDELNSIKTIMARANSLGIRVVIHLRSDDPDYGAEDAQIFIDEILAPHPDLKVQLAHLGSNGGFDEVTEEVFDTFIQAFEANPGLRKERLFFDLSFVILMNDQVMPDGTIWRKASTTEECARLAEKLRRWGINNIFWGSDFMMAEPLEYATFCRRMLPLSADEYNVIMNNNGGEFWG